MTTTNLSPKVTTSRKNENEFTSHQANFAFGISTLSKIAQEFNVPKSNEKAKTILNGLQAMADSEIANKLRGHRFILDRSARKLANFLVEFTPEVIEIINNLPSYDEDGFYQLGELTSLENKEAIKYKMLLKKILWFSRLLYVNKNDQNILTFEVTGEPQGEGLIQAIFAGGAEDRDIYINFGETTHFKLHNEGLS